MRKLPISRYTYAVGENEEAAPAMGVGCEGDDIAGAIIGGVSLTGGFGTVRWAALMIGVINNGMDLLCVDAFY